MQTNDLCYLTITEAAAGLRRKDFSSSDLTRACLERIDMHDSQLHSFITLTREPALRQAAQADNELRSGKDRGPLHGIPIGLKDLYATKGIRTTCHSAVLENWIPDHDATAVAKLAQAGSLAPLIQPFAALYVLILATFAPLLAKESERIYTLVERVLRRRRTSSEEELSEASVE